MSNEAKISKAETWARLFHDTYERLASSFGYETRKDTKQFDAASPNGRLMIAVCGEVVTAALADQAATAKAEAQLKESVWLEYQRTSEIVIKEQAATITRLTEQIRLNNDYDNQPPGMGFP